MGEKDLGVDLGRIGTVALHVPGTVVSTQANRKYRYVRAGAAIALGDVLIADVAEEVYAATPSSAADQTPIGCWPNESPEAGIARIAITDNYYFWMLEKGDALVKAAATVVAGAPIVTTATAGTVDDTAATAANALASASGAGGIFLTTTTTGFARVHFDG